MSEPILSPEQFQKILPLAIAWAEQQEATILTLGTALDESQLTDARKLGVQHPERIRLRHVPVIPIPDHPALRMAAEATGLISPYTAGLTLRYGIYIREDCTGDRHLLRHELVHTTQYERFGSIAVFLRQYLHECLTLGYRASPLEQEAILRARAVGG